MTVTPKPALIVLGDMAFAQRLVTARKQRGLTQQALADQADIHVTQIRRYEAGNTAPTLDILKKLAVALSVSADSLLFDNHQRGPDEDLKLQFEAISQLPEDERQTVKKVLEALLLRHQAKRWAA